MVGMGIEPPFPYEIKHKYLDMEYKDMEGYANVQREKWKTYECMIMCDEWIEPAKLSIINFMVYSKGNTIFLKSVDTSNSIKGQQIHIWFVEGREEGSRQRKCGTNSYK